MIFGEVHHSNSINNYKLLGLLITKEKNEIIVAKNNIKQLESNLKKLEERKSEIYNSLSDEEKLKLEVGEL